MWIVAYRRAGSLSHDQFPTHCVSHFPHHPQPHHTTTLHFPNFVPCTTVFKLCTPHQIHCAPHPPHRVHFAPHSTSASAHLHSASAHHNKVFDGPPWLSTCPLPLPPPLPLPTPLGFHQTDLLFVLTTPHPPHSYPQAKQTQMQQCSPASYM